MRALVISQKRGKVTLKPELVLHWLHVQLGDQLFDSFSCLDDGSPNLNHLVIAALLQSFSDFSFATTNFDRYLERALAFLGAQFRVYASVKQYKQSESYSHYEMGSREIAVLKLHGTLTQKESLRATLRGVSQPIHASLREVILALLKKRNVFILGYSGNDYDLFPTIAGLSNRVESIYWIYHGSCPSRLKEKMKSNVVFVQGDLNDFFDLVNRSLFQFAYENSISKRSVQRWSDKLDPVAAAYSLGILGAFIGSFPLASTMSNAVIKSRRSSRVLRARAQNILGICLKRKAPVRSMRCYRAALRLIAPVKRQQAALYGNLLGNLGSLYYEFGTYEKALECLRESSQWATKAKNNTLLAQNNDDIGNILRSKGLASQSISYHRKALMFAKKVGDLSIMARTLNNLGEAYRYIGRLDRALTYFRRSVDIKENETADIPALARGYMNLGEILILKGQQIEALDWLEKSLRMSGKTFDEVTKARVCYDMAISYLQLKNLELARSFLMRGKKLSTSIPHWDRDPHRIAWVNSINKTFDLASRPR